MKRNHAILNAVGASLVGAAASAQCGGHEAGASEATIVRASYDASADYNASAQYGGQPDIVDAAMGSNQFSTLVQALKAAHLVETLQGDGPFTVFAPTNAAFEKLPSRTLNNLLKPENREQLQSILTYHVVAGEVPASEVVRLNAAQTVNGQRVDIDVMDGRVLIDGAEVTQTDIETSNGIIHVIDEVIIPQQGTIPEVAGEAGSFSTLLKAVRTAGLADVLMGEGPFTVFAPTDAAFAELGSTVNELLKPANRGRLQDILKYHVVSGRVFADDAVKAGSAESLEGGDLRFGIEDARLIVNGTPIVSTNIDASNGVIHVIDGVLIPE